MDRHLSDIPADDWTVGELKDWLKAYIEQARQERGDEFDIEAALRITKNRLYTWVMHRVYGDYKSDLQAKFKLDPTRCVYCGNSLELYPGSGRYCDICTDKFSDFGPSDMEEIDE